MSLAAIAAVLSSSGLYADNFPTRPVTLTAVFGPGSANDTICRIIADPLGAALKRPVIVEVALVQTAPVAALTCTIGGQRLEYLVIGSVRRCRRFRSCTRTSTTTRSRISARRGSAALP